MEKHKAQKLVQYEELQPDEIINWSFEYYEDDFSSEQDSLEEPVARWIVRKKRKRLPIEEPDREIIQDLITNTKQQEPTQQSEGHRHSMKTFIEEAFRSIMIPVIFFPNNCLGISDPSNF